MALTAEQRAEFNAFVKMCRDHDWFYQFTEDPQVWSAGERSREAIRVEAERLGPDAQRFLRSYIDTVFHPGNGFRYIYPKQEQPT